MSSPGRIIARAGLVRAAAGGCVTIEVGVPCGSCAGAGCMVRQTPRDLELALPDRLVGEKVMVSLPAQHLTRISLTLFGPPLLWLAFTGLILADAGSRLSAGIAPATAIAGGSLGLAAALILGAWMGRRQAKRLALTVSPLEPASRGTQEV